MSVYTALYVVCSDAWTEEVNAWIWLLVLPVPPELDVLDPLVAWVVPVDDFELLHPASTRPAKANIATPAPSTRP